MSGLFEDCRDLFGTDDLYAVLSTKKSATEKEIKRAYHRLSLKVHPDRVQAKEKAESTRKFQALGKVYSVLSDADTRKVYDETGEVDDGQQEDKDWYQYWRLLFSKISVNDIQQFEEKYKDSEEELQDLIDSYTMYKGDMGDILDNMMCATVDDEPRFRAKLQDLVEAGELKKFRVFENDSDKKRKLRKEKAEEEATEAEKLKDELGLGTSDNDLRQMILHNRQKQADNFLNRLEAKYSQTDQPKKKKNKKK